MENLATASLERLLRQIQLTRSDSDAPGLSSDQQDLFDSICRLVFDGKAYQQLWDESLLSQLNWLFQIEQPDPTLFGAQVAELHQRTQQVQQVNNFFFAILSGDASLEEVEKALAALIQIDPSLLSRLNASDRLRDLRNTNNPPSEKIITFLNFLREEGSVDLLNKDPIRGSLEALKARECPGRVNA